MIYKVWIHIEEDDEEKDHYQDIEEPQWLAEFDSLAEARQYVETLPHKPAKLVDRLSESTDLLAGIADMAKNAGKQVVANMAAIASAEK